MYSKSKYLLEFYKNTFPYKNQKLNQTIRPDDPAGEIETRAHFTHLKVESRLLHIEVT